MKKQILRTLALVIFSTALLSGCAVENQGRRGRHGSRHYDDRYHHDNRYHDHDRDHHYNKY